MSGLNFSAFSQNFLGQAPTWYKQTIVAFLLLNPLLLATTNPFFTGWVLVLEFIFTLAMALRCYPLQPGGLLAFEAVVMGMTTPDTVKDEILAAFPVILLLVFMVAGIYFMKELLLFTFTKILLRVRSKILLSLMFSFVAAVLSAFLDALTVTAVVISVAVGFYSVYHRVASGKQFRDEHEYGADDSIEELHRSDLEDFRAFLRTLLMHAAVGTALGGVCTTVGEPQNLLIASYTGWDFMTFFYTMAPVTMPVLVVGLVTCAILERTRRFGYGGHLPEPVRDILIRFDEHEAEIRTSRDNARLVIQAIAALFLVFALAIPRGGGRCHRLDHHRYSDRIQRRHRRTSARTCIRRSAAIHSVTGGVLRNRRCHPRPASVCAGHNLGAGAAGSDAAGHVLHCQRVAQRHQRQCVRRDRLYRGGKGRIRR